MLIHAPKVVTHTQRTLRAVPRISLTAVCALRHLFDTSVAAHGRGCPGDQFRAQKRSRRKASVPATHLRASIQLPASHGAATPKSLAAADGPSCDASVAARDAPRPQTRREQPATPPVCTAPRAGAVAGAMNAFHQNREIWQAVYNARSTDFDALNARVRAPASRVSEDTGGSSSEAAQGELRAAKGQHGAPGFPTSAMLGSRGGGARKWPLRKT
mmetsp:Transcript_3341/g.9838  ORF Transcript_3341/g.9838 Transcript_3341/m.9838 type:complete len:215 (-) Transcript_3341:88-732(-)